MIDKLESTIEEENELTQEVVVSRKATDSPSMCIKKSFCDIMFDFQSLG